VKLIQSRLGLGRPRFGAPPEVSLPPAPEPQQVVTQLGEISRTLDLPVVVIRLEYGPGPPTALERTLEARVREEGMLYLDTRFGFRGAEPRQFWIHELDPPNARAHAIFGTCSRSSCAAAGCSVDLVLEGNALRRVREEEQPERDRGVQADDREQSPLVLSDQCAGHVLLASVRNFRE
jgi:hypothetical protein